MKLTYSKDVPSLLKGTTSLVLIGTRSALKSPPSALPAALREQIGDLIADAEVGDQGVTVTTRTATPRTATTPARLSAVVLPDKVSRYNCAARPECIQRGIAAAGLDRAKKHAVLCLVDEPSHLLPALNAVTRALPLLSLKSGKPKAGELHVLAATAKGAILTIDKETRTTVDATREAARLVDSPPTDMNPEALSKHARSSLGKLPGVKCREIAGAALLANGLGGLHAVGRTARKAPRLVIATYTPSRKTKKSRHIALVGKGITYDTGGLSLKTTTSMCTMKGDMGGAAAVLGAFSVLARTGCAHRLSMVLCLAENAIGPDAYKPDDVLTMHSGKTVEINNTDAEGRIVLADGVSYCARVLGADIILDAATLTGAQLVATGNVHAAVISNDEDLERRVVAAGFASGDLVHPLMFCPELYKREFKSQIADMKNSVRNRSNAQVSCAAQFIHWHIEDTPVRWCHVDLAGPAFQNERGTGFGTALLAEAVRRIGD